MAYTPPKTYANDPAGGTPIMADDINNWLAGIQAAAAQADSAYALAASSGGGGGTTITGSVNDIDFGCVPLDTFAGSGDDAKLAAALTALGADTYPRTLLLPPIRKYSFGTGGIVPPEGFRMSGAHGFSNPERNGGNKVATAVGLSMNGAWFTSGSGSAVYQVSMQNLSLEGSGTNATFIGSGSSTWYCLQLRNIYCNGLRSLIGTQANKALLTACTFDGSWEVNGSYSSAFHVGGSDNSFMWSSCLLDAAPAFATAGGSSGQAHFWADSLDKTPVGPLYITAESLWRGVKVSGPALNSGNTNAGSVQFFGIRAEGRNPGQPCNGSIISVSGGAATINGMWVAYGMASPSGGENGVIHHSGGQLTVTDVTYDATSSGQIANNATPFVYTTGGAGLDCIVQRIKRGSRGGSWGTNRPIVARATAGAENRITDATVTTVTV